MKLAQVEPDRANIGLVRAVLLAMTVPSTATFEIPAIKQINNDASPGRCSTVEHSGGVLPQHGSLNHIDFSVQPLCSLCLCGVFLLEIPQPQRHREHRGCTEKRVARAAKRLIALNQAYLL